MTSRTGVVCGVWIFAVVFGCGDGLEVGVSTQPLEPTAITINEIGCKGRLFGEYACPVGTHPQSPGVIYAYPAANCAGSSVDWSYDVATGDVGPPDREGAWQTNTERFLQGTWSFKAYLRCRKNSDNTYDSQALSQCKGNLICGMAGPGVELKMMGP
jgi:hypothetical protein